MVGYNKTPHPKNVNQDLPKIHPRAKDIPNYVKTNITGQSKGKILSSFMNPKNRTLTLIMAGLIHMFGGAPSLDPTKGPSDIYVGNPLNPSTLVIPGGVVYGDYQEQDGSFIVPQKYSKKFNEGVSENPEDDNKAVEFVRKKIQEITEPDVVAYPFVKKNIKDGKRERLGNVPKSKIKKINIIATSSPEANDPQSLIEKDQENEELGKLRLENGHNILNRAIEDLGIPDISIQGESHETSFSDKELEELFQLAKKLGYYNGGNNNFSISEEKCLNAVYDMINDYNDSKIQDKDDLKKLDDIVASKRSVKIIVEVSKYSEIVRIVPNPLLFLLILSIGLKIHTEAIPLNLTFYQVVRNIISENVLKNKYGKSFNDMTIQEKESFNYALYLVIYRKFYRKSNKKLTTSKTPIDRDLYEEIQKSLKDKNIITQIEKILSDMLIKNGLPIIKKYMPGLSNQEIENLSSDRNLQKQLLNEIIKKNPNATDIENFQDNYQGDYTYKLFLSEVFRGVELLVKRGNKNP